MVLSELKSEAISWGTERGEAEFMVVSIELSFLVRYVGIDIRMSTNWGSVERKVIVYCLEELGRRLTWVSKTVDPERITAVMAWLLGIVANPSKDVRVINLGNLVAIGLLTVMAVMGVVKELPALSLAVMVKEWEALVKVVVSKDLESVPVVELAITVLSTAKETKDKPEVTWPTTVGSEAWAVTVRVPETVVLLAGLVMEAVGGVVSGFRLTVTVTGAVTVPLLLVAVRV